MKKLTKDLSRGYVEYNGKKVPMYRNEAIAERFKELGIQVVDCKNEVEATESIKKLFSQYKKDYPQAFQQDCWFYNPDKTKFDLFEQWRKDNDLDFAGYQYSDGKHYPSDRSLYSWLPVRIGGEFAYMWSNRDAQGARCSYGHENDALPIFGDKPLWNNIDVDNNNDVGDTIYFSNYFIKKTTDGWNIYKGRREDINDITILNIDDLIAEFNDYASARLYLEDYISQVGYGDNI